MKISFLLLVYFGVSLIGFTQGKVDENLITYPISKHVFNSFDTVILEKVYNENKNTFEVSKNKLILERVEKSDNKDEQQVRLQLESVFSNSFQLDRELNWSDVFFEIDGILFRSMDTLSFRNILDIEKNKSLDKITETSISWNLKEFETIPLSRVVYDWGMNSPIIWTKKSIQEGQLRDGKYVMYYDPIYDKENQRFLSKVPFCYFEIENFKPHGEAIYFTHTGDTLAKGRYYKGRQDGLWKIRLPYSSIHKKALNINYESVLVDGSFLKHKLSKNTVYGWCTYILQFNKGTLNGDFIFKQDEKIRTIGVIENGKPVDNWSVFYKNGRLASCFTLREERISLNKENIYPEVYTKQIFDSTEMTPYNPRQPYFDIFPLGNINAQILGLTDYFTEFDNNSLVFYSRDDFEGVQELYIKGIFESYYENGQLFFKIKMDDEGRVVSFSSIYNEDGSLNSKWKFNKQRTKAFVFQYEYKSLNKISKTIFKVYVKNGKQVRKKVKYKPLFWLTR